MERVETLCERLKEQITKNVSLDELLMTVQMLQSELLHLKNTARPLQTQSAINIDIPTIILSPEKSEPVSKNSTIEFMIVEEIEEEKNKTNEIEVIVNQESVNDDHIIDEQQKIEEDLGILVAEKEDTLADEVKKEEEKVVMVLELDESAVEEELQQIKKSAEIKNTVSSVNKPLMLFNPLEEIPTLLHQRIENHTNQLAANNDANSQLSINDKLKQESHAVLEQLNNEPIKDLKKAISINERFLFISELFNGDEAMYDRSIKTINAFSIYPEAEYWIRRELKVKFAWEEKSNTVKQFNQLVKRRFSAT
jgi:hypothetical protein